MEISSCPYCGSEYIETFSFGESFCEYCKTWFTEEDFTEDVEEIAWGRWVDQRNVAKT